jgi:hypothetical protein
MALESMNAALDEVCGKLAVLLDIWPEINPDRLRVGLWPSIAALERRWRDRRLP